MRCLLIFNLKLLIQRCMMTKSIRKAVSVILPNISKIVHEVQWVMRTRFLCWGDYWSRLFWTDCQAWIDLNLFIAVGTNAKALQTFVPPNIDAVIAIITPWKATFHRLPNTVMFSSHHNVSRRDHSSLNHYTKQQLSFWHD